MGGVREIGRLEEVIEISGRCGWVRPVLDFANLNETKHLPYGEGTLRADPLKQALRKFRRPATVISESPDLESHHAIQAVLAASARTPSRRASSSSASSSRPRSRRN